MGARAARVWQIFIVTVNVSAAGRLASSSLHVVLAAPIGAFHRSAFPAG